uniref:Uncharacterized protein n=1 Tax=Anguilla anguilla TaxID=7936 RepID=A0A0E9SMP9_ANGAN
MVSVIYNQRSCRGGLKSRHSTLFTGFD